MSHGFRATRHWSMAPVSVLCLLMAVAAGMAPSSAEAIDAPAPWWNLTLGARPSSLPAPGGTGQLFLTAEDVGDAEANGATSAVEIEDDLPTGLEATTAMGIAGENQVSNNRGPVTCAVKPRVVKCTFEGVLPAFEEVEVQITVKVKPGASTGETNKASVLGGGAPGVVETDHPIDVGGAEAFGFQNFSLVPEEVGGEIDSQAGSHPFQMTSTVAFNETPLDANKLPRSVGLPRDVEAELPPGLLGNPTTIAQCTDTQFANEVINEETSAQINECPPQSAVGVATVSVDEPKLLKYATLRVPIFNMTPLAGEPARFGLKAAGIFPIFLDAKVRAGSDYGVTVVASNETEIAWPLSAKLTLWGTPADSRHDSQRGWECLLGFGSCSATKETNPAPFLVLPTSCEQPFQATLKGDTWATFEHPGEHAAPLSYLLPKSIVGCNRLPFSPSIEAHPDTSTASSATGLSVDVHVPQHGLVNEQDLAQSAIRETTVALPEGLEVNPSGANGLQACTEAQVGYLTGGPAQSEFTPTLGPPFCPDAAKVGTVQISTPLLPTGQDVEGSVYVAEQNQNPFGSLLALYIVASDPISGTVVKQAGEVHLTGTGQLISTLRNMPQVPFEDAKLQFFGGDRGSLATPSRCGTYATNASFVPWAATPPASSVSTFSILSGPHGGACPAGALPFSPALSAGVTNNEAGGFTSLTSTISREDGAQDFASVSVHTPPGLSGILTGVPLCPEPQADEGTCGADSLIGETTVRAGVGSAPITVTGGKVYLTGSHAGAPFGLSIVSPVKAGPFDLENTAENHPACDCIVVRARIEIDPLTAQLTVTTDPTGPHAIPRVIDGIPAHIQLVNVTVTRPHFTFNPTNCSALHISATITGDEGAQRITDDPFQAANCATLKFTPSFSVTTSGKTSRVEGASLKVKLSYPKSSLGSQTNIAGVKVELPKQLPSRLTTLQKACKAAVFAANPANCPPASIVGHAKVITPVLPVPLQGPAYFVSHGNEAFPALTIVLQGYGVTVQLIGSTLIRHGITSSTFKASPDVPFSSFELTLPQGPNSALGAYGNLCRAKLLMPTVLSAQNGAQKRQSSKIAVSGCRNAKKKHRRVSKHHH